ncbi:hypothetical protein GGS20DRAFT_549646 [Poronia punctata]|nr:hypothetical protein GGS20DRAFT_549646 [Poronia punctata]
MSSSVNMQQQVEHGTRVHLAKLLSRIHGNDLNEAKNPLWISSAETTHTLPKDQGYLDVASFQITGLPSLFDELVQPTFIEEKRWKWEIAPNLVNAILRFHGRERMTGTEITAMFTMTLAALHATVGIEEVFAGVFNEHIHKSLDPDIIHSVLSLGTRFLVYGGMRLTEINEQEVWYFIVHDVCDRTVYFIDPSAHPLEDLVDTHFSNVFYHVRRLWEQDIWSKNPELLPPNRALNLPMGQTNPIPGIPVTCVFNAYTLFRDPALAWQLACERNGDEVDKVDGKTAFTIEMDLLNTMIDFLSCSLSLSMDPKWESVYAGLEKPWSLSPIKIQIDEAVLARVLMVRKGNMSNVCDLLKSMYGHLPVLSDDFPIPVQMTSPRTISADAALYADWSPEATALMQGRRAQDDISNPQVWKNVVGPRLVNLLLRMHDKIPLGGAEIMAGLHMLLIEFFPGGSREPIVMTENKFGSFLRSNGPRDGEWEAAVTRFQPRFLILGRRQPGVYSHWYILIIEMATGKVYAMDSMDAQDNWAEHSRMFDRLRRYWPIRFPHLAVPQQMFQLPSYKSMEPHSPGYLCLYHVALLFRMPVRLWALENGDETAQEAEFDAFQKMVETYTGIRVVENMTFSPFDIDLDDPFVDEVPEKKKPVKNCKVKYDNANGQDHHHAFANQTTPPHSTTYVDDKILASPVKVTKRIFYRAGSSSSPSPEERGPQLRMMMMNNMAMYTAAPAQHPICEQRQQSQVQAIMRRIPPHIAINRDGWHWYDSMIEASKARAQHQARVETEKFHREAIQAEMRKKRQHL